MMNSAIITIVIYIKVIDYFILFLFLLINYLKVLYIFGKKAVAILLYRY